MNVLYHYNVSLHKVAHKNTEALYCSTADDDDRFISHDLLQ